MSSELGPAVIAFVALACLVAGFGHGALGFGFPIVATPLVALAIDIRSAIALLAPITLLLTVISTLRGVALSSIVREYWFLPLATALGAWLGTRILLAVSPEPFLLILAGVILLYLNLDRVGRGRSALVQRLRLPFGLGFGFVAGVCEALANVAGPILLIYFMLLGLGPAQIVQTLNLCFSLGKGAQTATWAMSGEISPRGWLMIGVFAAPSVAALFVGMRVRSRIDAPTYRRWLRGALWIMAALLLAQFSTRALAQEEALWRAIEQDDEAAGLALVRAGNVEVKARNASGDTPLHRAAEKGMRALAESLLARGAEVNARAKNGETPLHFAALDADASVAELLLDAGADANAQNKDGESILMWAALSGHVAVAQRLLAHGADANAKDRKGSLPLHAAADGGHLELARLLLPRTKEPGTKNGAGRSPLDYARANGYAQIEKLLEGPD
ncbi:MAG TPA: TSUP family transporter [Burkholderiales bacterium]|nr:TSUP family transporter [Burkholderiales bacterium]